MTNVDGSTKNESYCDNTNGNVSVIDGKSNELIKTISLIGGSPHNLAIIQRLTRFM